MESSAQGLVCDILVDEERVIMIKVKLDAKHHENLKEIEQWLLSSVGPGSRRYNSTGWMGADDWYYFEDYPEREPEFDEDGQEIRVHVDTSDHEELDLIFVFRRDEDMMMFSLKWV